MPETSENRTEPISAIDNLKEEVFDYAKKRTRLFKLEAFEKIGLSASFVGYGLMLAVIIATILFFILIGLAFFIGQLLNNLAAGFGILAIFSIVVLIVVLLCGKKIRRSMLQKLIIIIRKIDNANEDGI